MDWLREKNGEESLRGRNPLVDDHLVSGDGRYVVARKSLSDPQTLWAVSEARAPHRVLGNAGTREGAMQEAEIIEVARRFSMAVGGMRVVLAMIYARTLRRAAGIYLAVKAIRRSRHAHKTSRQE